MANRATRRPVRNIMLSEHTYYVKHTPHRYHPQTKTKPPRWNRRGGNSKRTSILTQLLLIFGGARSAQAIAQSIPGSQPRFSLCGPQVSLHCHPVW